MRLSLGLGCNYCTATAQGLVALPHKLIYSNSQLLWPIMNNMIILEPSLSSQPTYNLNETWDLNFHIFTATNSVSLQLQCLMWSRSKPHYATVCCTGSGVEEETGTYSQFWDLSIAIPITMHNELIVRIRGIFDAMRDGITDLFKTPSPSPGCEVLVVWCVE